MMEGLREITSGSVLIDGINVAKNVEQVKEIIGVQPQNSAFLDEAKLTELLDAFDSRPTFFKRLRESALPPYIEANASRSSVSLASSRNAEFCG